jgi:transcription initiation factor IIE alpha subunit
MYWLEDMKRWERIFNTNDEFIAKRTGLSKEKLREVLEVLHEYRIVD